MLYTMTSTLIIKLLLRTYRCECLWTPMGLDCSLLVAKTLETKNIFPTVDF